MTACVLGALGHPSACIKIIYNSPLPYDGTAVGI
jgi:hypothetical protein